MAKYVISGAGGFIGRNLCERLSKDHEVRMIPRDYLSNFYQLKGYLEHEQPDHIIHLASYGNHYHQTGLMQMYEVNVMYLLNFLLASESVKYSSFVNVGSSSEYGIKNTRMSELDSPDTDTFYGASKVAGTYLARAYATQHSKPICTVRPFSVYGQYDSPNHLIPAVIDSIVTGERFSLVTSPVHDFIHIDDFIDGLLLVSNNVDNFTDRVVNLGTGKQYTNQEIVDKLGIIADKTPCFDQIKSMRSYDSGCWVADNSRIVKLGWNQKYTIDRGLKDVFDKTTA